MRWLASGAFATAGLVWLTRLLRRKPVEREAWDSPPPAVKPGELPKAALTFPDDVEEDLNAAEDAARDIGEGPLDLDGQDEPETLDPSESFETVHAGERPLPPEEPYDAVDPEDLGTEWLFRAIDAPERAMTPDELAERAALEAGRTKR